jgi:hypothetical protein
MEVHSTPRQMAKALLQGIDPQRPLFLPIVFSLGARVESVPLVTFLRTPTKIASSLRQMRSHLRTDGLPCYFDPYLEVEALGATLQRISDDRAPTIHWPHPARAGELPEGLRSPEEATKSGRVPVAVEVIRMMNAQPNRDFLLMAGVVGPFTLATRLMQSEQKSALQCESLPDAALELAASVVTQMASTFLEAGADVIIIQEETLRTLSRETCDTWSNLVAPAINVIRFFEALPILLLTDAHSIGQNWDVLTQQSLDCVVSSPFDLTARHRAISRRTNGMKMGLALPLEAFRANESFAGNLGQIVQPQISDLRPAILTTAGDVPAATDMKLLLKVLDEVPRAF